MLIKVCGMCMARNISEVARLVPDFMGFIFYERSPRNACSTPPEALEVLFPETKRVGVFVDAPRDRILATACRYRLDFVQLHGSESPEICAELRAGGLGVIKAFGVGGPDDLKRASDYEGTCDYYLFDTRGETRGGTGRKFDHRLLAAYSGCTTYLLSGGLGPEDAGELIARRDPLCVGLDINSRFETAPGLKNPDAIKEFIKTIKQSKK